MTKPPIGEPLGLEGLPDAVSGGTLSETALLRKCAEAMNVPFAAVWRAKQIQKYGIPELGTAVWDGRITNTAACWAVTNLTADDQQWLLGQGTKREISSTVAFLKRAIASEQAPAPTHRCADCGSTNIEPAKTTRTRT